MKAVKNTILCLKITGVVKFYSLAFFLVAIASLSCSDSSRQKDGDLREIENNKSVKKEPAGSFSDTVIIDFPAAVFYYPDSLQLEKIKAILTKMEFESTAHECFYQMKNARLSLKMSWPQIRRIETSKARCILFIKSDKSKIYIDLNTQNDMCGLFLFNRKKNPILADMTNIGTELDFYFLK